MSLADKLCQHYGIGLKKAMVPNAPGLPQKPFRWIVAGQTGAGKTNKIFEHILNGELRFDKLYLYARHLFQDKYKALVNYYADLAERLGVPLDSLIEVGTEPEDIKSPDELDEEKDNLVIFDDFIASPEANDRISDWFIRGRHANASIIYLTQSYFNMPKVMRLQASDTTVFKTNNSSELRAIYQRAASNMDFDDFLQEFKKQTDQPYGSFTFNDRVD